MFKWPAEYLSDSVATVSDETAAAGALGDSMLLLAAAGWDKSEAANAFNGFTPEKTKYG